jgi:hypothetical protein
MVRVHTHEVSHSKLFGTLVSGKNKLELFNSRLFVESLMFNILFFFIILFPF